MHDEPGFLGAVLRELAASTAVILAAWGALGGATNALTTRMRLRDALRHVFLGGLIAAGMGSLSMALIVSRLALPTETIPAGGAAGSAAYLVGVFGPAFIELVLARLRVGKADVPGLAATEATSRPSSGTARNEPEQSTLGGTPDA